MAKRNSDLAVAIGKRMTARRKALGKTQEQIAEAAGLSQQFYACIERGLKGAGADSIVRICGALEVSADYLLTGAMAPEEQEYINKMLQLMTEDQRKAAEAIIQNLLLACGYTLPKK